MCFRLLVDIRQHTHYIGRGKPARGGIAFKPRKLPLGIPARVAFEQAYSLFFVVLPIHKIEYLLVAHGLQGLVVAVWIQRFGLLKQPGCYHDIHTLIDAGIQHLARQLQPDAHDAERVLHRVLPAKRCDGLAQCLYAPPARAAGGAGSADRSRHSAQGPAPAYVPAATVNHAVRTRG